MSTITPDNPTIPADLAEFVARCHEAVARQSNGDSEPLLALWSRADDASLMAATNGFHVGFTEISALLRAVAAGLTFDTYEPENLTTTVADGLAYTVELERLTRRADGPSSQITLRVTQVYRREDGRWRLVHRHAEALGPVSVETGRGE
jgi:ketosteroid isomerase-like protein